MILSFFLVYRKSEDIVFLSNKRNFVFRYYSEFRLGRFMFVCRGEDLR